MITTNNFLKMKATILIFFSAFFASAVFGQSQNHYDYYVKQAKKLYLEKQFLKSAQSYSQAFSSNGNLGRVDHRYSAACSWSMVPERDSAFYQLAKCVKAGFDEYFKVASDTTFSSLENDPRWEVLLGQVKNNREVSDKQSYAKIKNPDMAFIDSLKEIYDDDQLPRFQIDKIQRKYGVESVELRAHFNEMKKKDSINISKITVLFSKYGCPKSERIGEKGMHTIFLVIQHAKLATQEKFLPYLKAAAANGDIRLSSLAILEDRIAIRKGKKQLYGSQLIFDPEKAKYYVLPIRNPEKIDEMRKSVGLQPMNEYVSAWGLTWSISQYKKDLSNAKMASMKFMPPQ